jgi:casein kinase II subunit beta
MTRKHTTLTCVTLLLALPHLIWASSRNPHPRRKQSYLSSSNSNSNSPRYDTSTDNDNESSSTTSYLYPPSQESSSLTGDLYHNPSPSEEERILSALARLEEDLVVHQHSNDNNTPKKKRKKKTASREKATTTTSSTSKRKRKKMSRVEESTQPSAKVVSSSQPLSPSLLTNNNNNDDNVQETNKKNSLDVEPNGNHAVKTSPPTKSTSTAPIQPTTTATTTTTSRPVTTTCNMASSSSSFAPLTRDWPKERPLATTPLSHTSSLTRPRVPLASSPTIRPTQLPKQPTTTPITTTTSLITPWVRQFLTSRPKDALLPVPKDFLSDGFNLAQLAPIVERVGWEHAARSGNNDLKVSGTSSYPIYRQALGLLLQDDESDTSTIDPSIQHAAEILYLLVHARFVSSPRGLDTMRRLVHNHIFGQCPRQSCGGMSLLPTGVSENVGQSSCQRYCPACGETWAWWDSCTDGCAWGPSFCHLWGLTHGEGLVLEAISRRPISPSTMPLARIFGFPLHTAAAWGTPPQDSSRVV